MGYRQVSLASIDFYARDLTIIRHGAGGYDAAGVWQDAQEQPATIRAGFNPKVSQSDLMQMPEAERTEKMATFWSREEIRTTSEDETRAADLMIVHGEAYRIVTSVRRDILVPGHEGTFWRAIGVLYRSEGRHV